MRLRRYYDQMSDEEKNRFWKVLYEAMMWRGSESYLKLLAVESRLSEAAKIIEEATGMEVEKFT